MRLRPLQLCRTCASFKRWRWLWLGAAALAALLLPGVLRSVGLTLCAGAAAVLALYALLRHACHLPHGQRAAQPEDALCETVLVDAALIGRGTHLRAASQPVDVAAELSLRLGSGALLLGTAMTITADELPQPDQLAIHRAVQALNIVPQRMRSYQPVLERTVTDSVTCVRVRDGLNERCYYMGAPAGVAALCPRIWEGDAHPMSDHDRLRLADTARYIAQGKCRVTAYATALKDEEPVFLGMVGVGEELDPRAVQAIGELREMGLTVMLHGGDEPETDAAPLRALLQLPDVHARADIHLTRGDVVQPTALTLQCSRETPLSEPIRVLRECFGGIERALRRFALMLCIALAPCLATGWTGFLAALILLGGVFFLGDKGESKLPGKRSMALCGLATLLFWLFLSVAEGATLAHGLLCILTALGAALRLCNVLSLPAVKENRNSLKYLLGLVAGCLLAALVVGLMQGVTLLPTLFALLMGMLMFALLVLM